MSNPVGKIGSWVVVTLGTMLLVGCATSSPAVEKSDASSAADSSPSSVSTTSGDESDGSLIPSSLNGYTLLDSGEESWKAKDYERQPDHMLAAIDSSGCVNLRNAPLAPLFAAASGEWATFITPSHTGLIGASVLKSSPAAAAALISEIDRCSAKWPDEHISKTAVSEGAQYAAPFRGTSVTTTLLVRPNGYLIAIGPNAFAMGTPAVTELTNHILAATN